jgi:hypothetical protein
MICTGTDLALSPVIWISALAKGPQRNVISANCVHSNAVFPLEAAGWSGIVRTEDRIRSPSEPVSTWTWSIVWQLLVPGTHNVTVVKARSFEPMGGFPGPASTIRVATLFVFPPEPPGPLPEPFPELELPPPPQEHAKAAIVTARII